MRIYRCAQGSEEWLELRRGLPTASEFGEFMKLNFELRDSAGYWTYVYRKLAEHLVGPLPAFGGQTTDQGGFLEPEAIPFFEMETDLNTEKVGFILSDDGRCGCSPDALIGEESGLEIKCPFPTKQIQYVCEGTLPNEYAAQVHGSMFVTGRKEWHFMSYHRKLPPLHLVVKRDEAIIEKIGKCLERFYKDFDEALERLRPTKETK